VGGSHTAGGIRSCES